MAFQWHNLSLEEVFKKVETSKNGLASVEAEKRFKRFGANELPEAEIDSWAVIFFRQFRSSLIYVLLVAAIVVFLLGEYIDGFIIIFVLVFNAIIGTIQEGKARNTLRALKDFVETYVTALRDGAEVFIRDTRLVPGDVVLIREGDKVPADCRVINVNNLIVNEASLTGESAAVLKTDSILRRNKLAITEQKNMIFRGTSVISGSARAIVVETGLKTEIGKISQTIIGQEAEIPFRANIRYLSYSIIAAVSVISSLLFVFGIWRGINLKTMFLTVVSVSVSIIPEGLPVVTTLILAFGVMRMAKRKALVKRLQAVEALGQARVIAVDKTGTITRNQMAVTKIFIGGKLFDAKSGKKKINIKDSPELLLAGKIAVYSADARIIKDRVIGDPTEAAMLILAERMGMKKKEMEKNNPIIFDKPFDYKKKYRLVSHLVSGKKFITVTGAPERVISMCNRIWFGGKELVMSNRAKKDIGKKLEEMAREGLRVIAFAYGEHGLKKLAFAGFYGIEDEMRSEVPAAVKKVMRAGMKVVMITGDHKETAIAVAKKAGIFTKGDLILTGEDLSETSNRRLDSLLDKVSVFARVIPNHKVRIIEAYRRRKEIVAMTGDGVNDAPSLVAADLGVTMGIIGTPVAREASDIVLLDDNFGTITAAVEEGRAIYRTIKKAILYLFSTSAGEVLAISASIFLGWPLLLLPSQIIWLNFITDGFLTAAFAWEPKDKNLLRGGFERPKKFLIDRLMVERAIIMSLVMMVGSVWVFNWYFRTDLPKALTMSLTTLAIMQWFNAWNVRSQDQSVFKINWLSNKFLFLATFIVISLQIMVIYWHPLQVLFRTVPLTLFDWLLAIIISSFIIIAEEIRKYLWRTYFR